MIRIKVGKKKVKIFNLLLLILILIIFLYLLGCLIFMFPLFKENYSNKEKYENYELDFNTSFRTKYFSCIIKEEVSVKSSDKLILDEVTKDLLKDGYLKKDDNLYTRKLKVSRLCKNVKKDYKKVHNSSYIAFKLNGNAHDILNYKEEYKDLYVTALKNNKELRNIEVLSNYNENKIGDYITSYKIKINNFYNKRLYRKISIIDNEKPTITLIGEEKIYIDYGNRYIELGFNATDNYDGDIIKNVKIKENINSKKPGVYKVTYTVSDSSGNKNKVTREVIVKEKEKKVVKQEPIIEEKKGITYVNGVLLVNKKYSVPKDYNPGVNKEALKALEAMQADAKALGLDLSLISGYRSYSKQEKLYNSYVKEDGEEKASSYSAKPGHSEHQTGLAFDIGCVDDSFKNTDEAKWIDKNAYIYGFIVRYPKDKIDITGYIYEPWHVRYLGTELATQVYKSGLSLEEYLGVN